MSVNSKQFMIMIGIIGITVGFLTGCEKKSEPVQSPVEATVTEATEQKLCPIMDSPINKELYTEYEGQKVYFCCPGCEEKFKEDPEKYLEKLPQFQ